MRNYISQGLGRKQKLTQLVFLKRYLMKGLGWHTGLGRIQRANRACWVTQGPRTAGRWDHPLSQKDREENVTIRVHLRAGAWKGASYTHCKIAASRAEQGTLSLLQTPLLPVSNSSLAEPNQKSKSRSQRVQPREAGSWSTEHGREGMKIDTERWRVSRAEENVLGIISQHLAHIS